MTKRKMADLMLLLITLIWGSTFTLMRNTLENISAFQLLSLRFTSALIVLLLIFHQKLKCINLAVIKYGSLIGLMLCGSLIFQIFGLKYTTASNSSFITSLNVLIVPILSAFIFKKKISLSSILGIVMALCGMFFLMGGITFSFGIGELLTIFCAFCVSFQILFIDKFSKSYDPILLGIVQIAFSSLCCSIGWFFTDFSAVIFNVNIVITVFVTGVLATAFAFTCQTIVQKFTSPTHTALIFSLEPVFGLLFALLIPDTKGVREILTYNKILGCILILGGVIVSELNLIKNLDFKVTNDI